MRTNNDSPLQRTLALGALVLCSMSGVAAEALGQDRLILRGTVRDFKPDHPDFDISATGGHFAGNVGLSFAGQYRPSLTETGFGVSSQFRDRNSNPIAPHLFNAGMVSVGVVSGHSIQNQSFADSFDESEGPYGGTNVGPAPTFITGSTMPSISAPTMSVSFQNEYKRVSNHGTTTLSTDIYCRDFTVANHHVLSIDGNVTVYATESFKIQNQAQLVLLPGATLTLYVAKVCTFQDGAMVNMTSPDSNRFRIFNLGTEPVLVQNQSHVYANVISPFGNLELQDGAHLYGAATALSVRLQNQAGLHINGVPNLCGITIDDTAGTFGAGSSYVTSAASFNQWFRNISGINASKRHDIILNMGVGGDYDFIDNAFAPIDGILYGNGGAAHNAFFTYEIPATFTYNACSGQYLGFEGNDDCWVYVDDKLAIDLGGINATSGQFVDFDRLGLTDGQVYSVRLFYAHRSGSVARFHLRTNVTLIPAPFDQLVVSSPYFD